MYSLLLSIIYIAFISLGLPDSLLGSGWPVMYKSFNVPVSYAGIISMIISAGTILSSLMSDKLTKKLGAGLVTAISVMLTALALFGFSVSGSFLMICLIAIPYGLGAGAVDAALNNYVALHYAPRHMSWLHCFWGIGTAISPYIMSNALHTNAGWPSGYKTISTLQIILTLILFLSIPLWKKVSSVYVNDQKNTTENEDNTVNKANGIKEVLKLKGVKLILFAFFGYCALETTAGLWASSYLVLHSHIDTVTAAKYASLFFLGITFGRFICGFITEKLGDKMLIRIGICLILTGIIILLAFSMVKILTLSGLLIIGLGCAPVYPSIIHATPYNFGKENSQAVIGIQMASAYTGSTLMPPLFGLLTRYLNIGFYPVFLLIFAILMLVMTEKMNIIKSHSAK